MVHKVFQERVRVALYGFHMENVELARQINMFLRSELDEEFLDEISLELHFDLSGSIEDCLKTLR